MGFSEAEIVGYMLSGSELFVGAVYPIAICKSDKTASKVHFVQCRFVDNPHSPHARPIKTATKALTASNFHFRRAILRAKDDTVCFKVSPSF